MPIQIHRIPAFADKEHREFSNLRKSFFIFSRCTGWFAVFIVFALGILSTTAHAQPAGWTHVGNFSVSENSGAALTDYPLKLVLDTAQMIAAGQLKPDGSDLRFGVDQAGSTLMTYWVESGMNTASTTVWVKLPSLPASLTTQFFIFSGNPLAIDASTLDVFGTNDLIANSSTNQVTGGGDGAVTDSQRGFRFQPKQDVLVTALGKNEPNGTTRYVTLFDGVDQNILAQLQVAGPAATYSYQNLQQPIWLRAGHEYIVTLYQGSTDGYYFGPSTQIHSALTYLDIRYCNGCDQNTFPTKYLQNYHYGYPDFQLHAPQQVSPAPSYAMASVTTTVILTSSANPSQFQSMLTLTASISPTVVGTLDFFSDTGVAIGGCTASPLVAGVATCTTSALSVGSHQLMATYAGTPGILAATSPSLAQVIFTVPNAPLAAGAVGGDSSASVSWTAPTNDNGSAITGYTVQAFAVGTTSPALGQCITPAVSPPAPVATSCTVTGLTNGTSYVFTVAATNAAGTGVNSLPSAAVTPVAGLAQSPPPKPVPSLGVVGIALLNLMAVVLMALGPRCRRGDANS